MINVAASTYLNLNLWRTAQLLVDARRLCYCFLADLCPMSNTCALTHVLTHTRLLEGHRDGEVGHGVFHRYDQCQGTAKDLTFFQFDKYEHCKHSGFALSRFHSARIAAASGGGATRVQFQMRMKERRHPVKVITD